MSTITTIRNNLKRKKKTNKKSEKEDENEFYLRLMYLLSLPA